jgi:hypothetical protein
MTEPKTKLEGILSVGAKTYIRSLAAQEIFGVDFEVSSAAMEKGTLMEGAAIEMLNRVRGLSLQKNTERKSNGYLAGEADLFYQPKKRGHDIKNSWSLATFPILEADCYDKLYEWQMRGYMALWDAEEWEVDYCMLSTPEGLIRYEPQSMHFVDHIPEHLRITSWVVKRDMEKEEMMFKKVKAAREYMRETIEKFAHEHALNA